MTYHEAVRRVDEITKHAKEVDGKNCSNPYAYALGVLEIYAAGWLYELEILRAGIKARDNLNDSTLTSTSHTSHTSHE